MNTTKPTWSKRDEYDLQDLLKRKAAFDVVNREPVLEVVKKLRALVGVKADPQKDESVATGLINMADAIRDALAPFDSGVRVAQSDSTSG